MEKNRVYFITGTRKYLARLVFLFKMIKYLVNKKSFPLFYLSKKKMGLFKTYERGKELGLKKSIKYNNSTFFSLTIPHYPSKAYDNAIANGMMNVFCRRD